MFGASLDVGWTNPQICSVPELEKRTFGGAALKRKHV